MICTKMKTGECFLGFNFPQPDRPGEAAGRMPNNTLQMTFDLLRTLAVAGAHIASSALERGR